MKQGDETYYYWDTTSSTCKTKGGLGYSCSCPTVSASNSQCNTTLNLACYTSSACAYGLATGLSLKINDLS